jgi:hypothetical protein
MEEKSFVSKLLEGEWTVRPREVTGLRRCPIKASRICSLQSPEGEDVVLIDQGLVGLCIDHAAVGVSASFVCRLFHIQMWQVFDRCQ